MRETEKPTEGVRQFYILGRQSRREVCKRLLTFVFAGAGVVSCGKSRGIIHPEPEPTRQSSYTYDAFQAAYNKSEIVSGLPYTITDARIHILLNVAPELFGITQAPSGTYGYFLYLYSKTPYESYIPAGLLSKTLYLPHTDFPHPAVLTGSIQNLHDSIVIGGDTFLPGGETYQAGTPYFLIETQKSE